MYNDIFIISFKMSARLHLRNGKDQGTVSSTVEQNILKVTSLIKLLVEE